MSFVRRFGIIHSTTLGQISCDPCPQFAGASAALAKLCRAVQAHEVILLEKNTLLWLSSANSKGGDEDEKTQSPRHDNLSTVLKAFKIRCQQWEGATIQSVEITRHGSVMMLEPFTTNTILLAMMDEPQRVYPEAVRLTLRAARPHFEKIFAASA